MDIPSGEILAVEKLNLNMATVSIVRELDLT